MKQLLSLSYAMLMLISANFGQTKTINIYSASLSYDSIRNNFVVRNIVCGLIAEAITPARPRFSEPGIKLLIETGDGRCIDTTATYSQLKLNNGNFLIPHTYRRNAAFSANARIVKTYDKGGPRTRMLQTTARSIRIDRNMTYPALSGGPIKMRVIPGDIVPGDTMTAVITVKSDYLNDKTWLFMHDSLSICNIRITTASVDTTTSFRLPVPADGRGMPLNDSTRILPFEMSNRESAGNFVNIFFEVVPARGLTNFDMGELLTFGLNDASGELQLVDSHDPNQLRLLRSVFYKRSSQYPYKLILDTNIRTLSFRLDLENNGAASENNIRIGLRFKNNQLLNSTIKFTEVIFRDGDTSVVMRRTSQPHVPDTLPWQEYASNLTYRCDQGMLEGTNHLPDGHPKTKAVIYFTITTQNYVKFHDVIPVSAVIWFGSKPTRTEEIKCRLMDANNPINSMQAQ
ncbi:MAG: hypothetical protein WCF67_11880 [Chitinophagaceae bacterium]